MIWKRKITLEALNAMGEGNMVGLLDIRFEHIGDDTLEATMPVDSRTKQPFGLLHGGALKSSSICGTLFCAWAISPNPQTSPNDTESLLV